MSSKKVFAIAGIHFLLSWMAMTAYMGLKLHNPDTDPNGALKDAIASGLEWICFFPSIALLTCSDSIQAQISY